MRRMQFEGPLCQIGQLYETLESKLEDLWDLVVVCEWDGVQEANRWVKNSCKVNLD